VGVNKKNFVSALRKTTTDQKIVIDERFAKADAVLLTMKSDVENVGPTSGGSITQESHKVESVIRDTFSMPRDDHTLIEQLRVRAAKEGRNTNKSEVIRAGLRALESISSDELITLLDRLERIKPGRK